MAQSQMGEFTQVTWMNAGRGKVTATLHLEPTCTGQTFNQSINQSKHISIAPYVASESEAITMYYYSQYKVNTHLHCQKCAAHAAKTHLSSKCKWNLTLGRSRDRVCPE